MKSSALILLVVIALVGSLSVFTVDEREKAILFQLGEIVKTDFEPGLHFKIPLVNNVRKFDGRILTLDSQAERFLTAKKKNMIVDSYMKWRIADVGRFYTSVSGDVVQANVRLDQILKDGLRGEFSKRTIREVISGDRREIMKLITAQSGEEAAKFGIEVVDVRLKRIDLPANVTHSVFRRMEAERARAARDLRSQGAEEAERIRAKADRDRTEIVAEAYRDAEKLRGEGDAVAADTYATAFDKNADFYALYRSLTAYGKVFDNSSDMLVLEPDSEFFRFFKDQQGGGKSR